MPFGPEGEQRRWAELMALTFNANRGEKQKAADPDDFLPQWIDPEEEIAPVTNAGARLRERMRVGSKG